MGAAVSVYTTGRRVGAVVLETDGRAPQLWVSSRSDGYADLFERFCIEKLNVKPSGSFRNAGYDLDHAYCRSAVPLHVRAFIRLFLVPIRANRSWGGYFERKLKDRIAREVRIGVRNETVAIRAKIAGIPAPRIGRRVRRRADRIMRVIEELADKGMIGSSTAYADFESLVAFCDVANGKAHSVTSVMAQLPNERYTIMTWSTPRPDAASDPSFCELDRDLLELRLATQSSAI